MSPQIADVLQRDVMPIIVATLPHTARPVGCEDAAELIQDCLLMAALMLEALEQAAQPVIPQSVAYYSIQRIKSGRRSYSSGRTDVMSAAAQLDSRSSLVSLDHPLEADADDALTIGDTLACAGDDPSMVAARELDWQELGRQLGRRKCQVIAWLHEGRGTSEIARRLQVSAPRVTQLKRAIAKDIRDRWGVAVLANLEREPRWKAGLRTRQTVRV